MLHVLKYVGNGPDDFMEHAYDETIIVKNRIALCSFEHNRDMLLGMNFESLGTIENEGDLKELFKNGDVQVATRKEKVETPTNKVVPINSVLPSKVVEGSQKSWYENIE